MMNFEHILGYLCLCLCVVVGWHKFGFAGVLMAVACLTSAMLFCGGRKAHDDDEDEEFEVGSCAGCKNDLGGGHCRINMERECREGGGFELWEGAEDEQE